METMTATLTRKPREANVGKNPSAPCGEANALPHGLGTAKMLQLRDLLRSG